MSRLDKLVVSLIAPLVSFGFSSQVRIVGTSSEFHSGNPSLAEDLPAVTYEFETNLNLLNGEFTFHTGKFLNQGRKGQYDVVQIDASLRDGTYSVEERFGTLGIDGKFVPSGIANDHRGPQPGGFLSSWMDLTTGRIIFPQFQDIGAGYGSIEYILSKIPEGLPFGLELRSSEGDNQSVEYILENTTHRFILKFQVNGDVEFPALVRLTEFSQIHRPENLRILEWTFSEHRDLVVLGRRYSVPYQVSLEIQNERTQRRVRHELEIREISILDSEF